MGKEKLKRRGDAVAARGGGVLEGVGGRGEEDRSMAGKGRGDRERNIPGSQLLPPVGWF